MDEIINPIQIMGKVQCRHCGNNMNLIITSADAVHLDNDGTPCDVTGLIAESYLLCSKCGHTCGYTVDPDTRNYKIIDEIDSFGDITEESIEQFASLVNDANPFYIKDNLKGKGD